MAALVDYLRGAGLAVELEGERLRVTPADRLTEDLRQFVRDYRAELLAELSTVNDAQSASEPQHFVRTAATASPEWLVARDQYHGHIFACCHCHPPTGRYCPTGTALRVSYDATPMELRP